MPLPRVRSRPRSMQSDAQPNETSISMTCRNYFKANLGREPKRHTSANPTLALLIVINMISITFIKRWLNCFVPPGNNSKSGH